MKGRNRNKNKTNRERNISINIVAWTDGYGSTGKYPKCPWTDNYFPIRKKDIFKVIMTVQGLNHNTGDIVTIVNVNGESRVKLFDDSKTYIHSIKADGTGGLIEYVATFPNTTVKTGDVFKACALIIKDSNLLCETGTNSPALRPEFKGLYLQQQQDEGSATASSQAARVTEEEK